MSLHKCDNTIQKILSIAIVTRLPSGLSIQTGKENTKNTSIKAEGFLKHSCYLRVHIEKFGVPRWHKISTKKRGLTRI